MAVTVASTNWFILKSTRGRTALCSAPCAALVMVISIAFGVSAQVTSAPLSFEVASVKPAMPGAVGQQAFAAPGGRFTAVNATAKLLISVAYGVRTFQVLGGPDWAATDSYDISAKGRESATSAEIKRMLQTLLSERFNLTVRNENRLLEGYVLVLAKSGPKLKEVAAAGRGIAPSAGTITGVGAPMTLLAKVLSDQVGATVINETELEGFYDFKLVWAPDEFQPAKDSGEPLTPIITAGPSIFTALQEDLGLRLERRKVSVDVVVIDSLKQPSKN